MWGEGGHRPLSAFQAPSVGSVFTSSLFRLVLLAKHLALHPAAADPDWVDQVVALGSGGNGMMRMLRPPVV